jgi:hypothetical protein
MRCNERNEEIVLFKLIYLLSFVFVGTILKRHRIASHHHRSHHRIIIDRIELSSSHHRSFVSSSSIVSWPSRHHRRPSVHINAGTIALSIASSHHRNNRIVTTAPSSFDRIVIIDRIAPSSFELRTYLPFSRNATYTNRQQPSNVSSSYRIRTIIVSYRRTIVVRSHHHCAQHQPTPEWQHEHVTIVISTSHHGQYTTNTQERMLSCTIIFCRHSIMNSRAYDTNIMYRLSCPRSILIKLTVLQIMAPFDYILIDDRWLIDTAATTPHNMTGLPTVLLVVPVHVAFGRHLSTEYGVESLVLTTGQHLQFDRNFQGSP